MTRTRLHKGKRWFSVEHGFFSHPKTVRAGEGAAMLFLAGLDYCGERLTDGVIPKAMVARLTSHRNWQVLAARLVEVGYWHDRGDAYESHEYLARYPSKAKVEADLEKDRSRKGGSMDSTRIPDGTGADSSRIPEGSISEEGRIEGEEEVKTPSRPPPGGHVLPGFKTFWATFPDRPAGKGSRWRCEAIWARDGCESQTGVILAALAAFTACDQWRKDGGHFIPMAQTWLGQRRYEAPPMATSAAELPPGPGFVERNGRQIPIAEDQAAYERRQRGEP